MDLPQNITALAAALALLGGCAVQNAGAPPPSDGFYFPVSVALGPSAAGVAERVLFVASSNFDLRYNRGTVVAVDLDKALQQNNGVYDGPVHLSIDPSAGVALIDNFAGQLLPYQPVGAPASQRRLFVPSRSANALYALQSDGATLTCPGAPATQDCLDRGIALTNPDSARERAENPFGLALEASTHRLFITHVRQADDPPGSLKNGLAYVAHLDAETLDGLTFILAGLSPSDSIVDSGGARGLFFSGRSVGVGSMALRSVKDEVVTDLGLTTATGIWDTRGVAVSSDRARLYLTSTSGNLTTPAFAEGLLVLDIATLGIDGLPLARVINFVSLPAGAAFAQVIPRAGMRDLVAVTCTQSNSVALYDDEVGALSAVVGGVQEPYGLVASSADAQGAVRLYVASFGNDTVDVIHVPDPARRPREAVLEGHLGFPAHRPLGVTLP